MARSRYGIIGEIVAPDGRKAPARIDLVRLLRSGAVIEGNSGAGKSWLIRKLVETFAIAKLAPQWVFDPEDEYATLREKFDFLLVGPGGDIPADVRTAALLARRLMEIRVSAIFNLSEMDEEVKQEWLRIFFMAVIDSPRTLWKYTLLYLDEAHIFAPERGEGTSVASRAVRAMATRGRKRGKRLICASNRPAIFDKTVVAQMPNKIVGMISIDIDQDRAARSMGIRQKDKPDFFDAITNFEPGTFFVRGPAFAVQKAKIAVGKTLTTHLDPGEVASRHKPPTPGAIKRILSELKDLPDEAEEEVATVEGFKKKIRELEGALREAKHATPVVKETAPEKIKVPMIRKGELARLARMTKKLVKAEAALTSVLGSSLDGLRGAGDQLSQRQQVVVSMLGNLQVALQGTPTKIQTNTTYGKLDKTGAPSEHELKLIANGHVILAIKSYRERTGASLLDAKNVMDIARDPSKTAYFGGKVERFKKNGNSVHAADIASAYPKELTSPPPAKEGSIKALGWKLFGVIASVYPRSMKSRTACTLVGVSRRSSAVDLQLAALRKTALIQSRDGENELTSTGLGLAKARKLIGITHKSPIEALEDCLGRLKKKAARDILQVVAFAGEAGITRAAIIEKLGRSNKSSDVDLAFSQLKGVGWVSKEDDRFVAAKEIRPS